ncbi:DUF1292 domain-containing protein [Alkalicoccus halolimnae]|jgi:uncharacterized protein YrzB (UPF0473 family)|uniref:UPF0473 protein FTX54_006710 n=1 Tax=Alkalicoccus halolimnae TaxID=1667239 RepID=A0A5C7FJM3_9BACI|nr:DUF1292 domain-containing protein [Alkalicoccus halolimnae]TXF86494.1 DUF1292 domain-containing protein [Alkalicoccus halolimnae]
MSDINIKPPEGDDNRIIIPDENGDEHLFEILFTFDVDSTGTSYIVLAPEGSNDDEETEEVEVHAFRYEDKEGEDIALLPIETEEEWEMVEELLNTFTEE